MVGEVYGKRMEVGKILLDSLRASAALRLPVEVWNSLTKHIAVQKNFNLLSKYFKFLWKEANFEILVELLRKNWLNIDNKNLSMSTIIASMSECF